MGYSEECKKEGRKSFTINFEFWREQPLITPKELNKITDEMIEVLNKNGMKWILK